MDEDKGSELSLVGFFLVFNSFFWGTFPNKPKLMRMNKPNWFIWEWMKEEVALLDNDYYENTVSVYINRTPAFY